MRRRLVRDDVELDPVGEQARENIGSVGDECDRVRALGSARPPFSPTPNP
jgi:hypothetical protein